MSNVGFNNFELNATEIAYLLDGSSLAPEEYSEMVREVRRMMCYYRCAMMAVETKFRILNEQFSLTQRTNPINSIQTRLKSPESIKQKLQRRGLPATLQSMVENLDDVAGVRVICSFVDEVYDLADYLLQQDDIVLIQRKDYIENPKENGYRSLHLIIKVPVFIDDEKRMITVEVQLRTIAMEFWANLEHKMRYKKDMNPKLLKQVSLELMECAQMSAILDMQMQQIRETIDGTAHRRRGNSPEEDGN